MIKSHWAPGLLPLPHEDNVLNKFRIWKERHIQMRENRTSHLVGWKNHPTIAPVGDRTHDLPRSVASNMVNVSHALTHSAMGDRQQVVVSGHAPRTPLRAQATMTSWSYISVAGSAKTYENGKRKDGGFNLRGQRCWWHEKDGDSVQKTESWQVWFALFHVAVMLLMAMNYRVATAYLVSMRCCSLSC